MTIDVFERAHDAVEAFLHVLRLGHRDMLPVQDSNNGKNIAVENGAGLGICLLYQGTRTPGQRSVQAWAGAPFN